MRKWTKVIIAILLSVLAICSICLNVTASDFSDKFELYESWDKSLKEYTMDISKELDVPYSALIAIIYHESRFNSDVGTKYIGLMQVGSTTDVLNFLSNNGMDISKQDLYVPEINIKAGALILRYAIDTTGNIEDAFYVYTCGESAVESRVSNGLPKNKATVEITELYYDYCEYFNEKDRTEYKELLLDELDKLVDEVEQIESKIKDGNEYEVEYYNQKLHLINQNIDFIIASLDSVESEDDCL